MKLQAENPANYATVLAKFLAYFHKWDPQLMLREKFWLHLRREPAQTFNSWVVTIKERASECNFPIDFYEQALRDKLTFSCKEDSYKLKLHDQGAALLLENTVEILSYPNVSCKSQRQQRLRVSHSKGANQTIRPWTTHSKAPSLTLEGDHSSQAAGIVDTAITSTPPDATSATNWDIFP